MSRLREPAHGRLGLELGGGELALEEFFFFWATRKLGGGELALERLFLFWAARKLGHWANLLETQDFGVGRSLFSLAARIL